MLRIVRRAFQSVRKDVCGAMERDPAAKSKAEVILTYSGLHAIWLYRIAHWFYCRKWVFLAKLISQGSRFLTGIEIHPAAKIGENCFIDHGMDVVIGETCEIGNHVTIYQGVTLGGTGKEKGKRHPTIKDEVMISSGAKVLGSITVEKGSKIGAGSIVLKDVPQNATVVGVPGRIVIQDGVRVPVDLDHGNLPDPIFEKLRAIEHEIHDLKDEIAQLKDIQRSEVYQIERKN
jgi:serine O-acetyltransferase